MKKLKPLPCPFCGRTPTGERFCSTPHGPAVSCDHCHGEGPPAGTPRTEFTKRGERLQRRKATLAWNKRGLDSASYRRGIEAAASFVEQFDKYVRHDYRLSDCILGKFNMIGRRNLRKNVPEQRTPVRRKKERRMPGGPEFALGSTLSRERRQRTRREGARRRR
jgi:hypothetical protein